MKRAEMAGVKRTITPHLFRYTFRHEFEMNGGSEGAIMAIGGWSQRSMIDHYGAAGREERAKREQAELSIVDNL